MGSSDLRLGEEAMRGEEPFRWWHAVVLTVAMLGFLTPAVIDGIGGVALDGITLACLFPGVGLLAFLWTWLTALPGILALRRRSRQHWSETARRLHPHRSGTAVVIAMFPGVLMLLACLAFQAKPAVLIGIGVTGAAGCVLGSIPIGLAMGLRQRVPVGYWLRILLTQPAVFYGAILVLMPGALGWSAWGLLLIVVVRVVLLNVWGAGGSVHTVRPLQVTPELEATAERLARDSGIRLRRVVLADAESAGAYAFPFTKEILVTRGLIELLGPSELEAVLAHEMDHLRESRWMTLARVVSANSFLPLLLVRPLMAELGPIVIGPLTLWWALVPRLISRWVLRHEAKADHRAASVDPVAYGRALLRLHESNLIPAVLTENLTHPNLYDRLVSCGVTPDFPRPAAAAIQSPFGVLTSAALGGLGVAVALWAR